MAFVIIMAIAAESLFQKFFFILFQRNIKRLYKAEYFGCFFGNNIVLDLSFPEIPDCFKIGCHSLLLHTSVPLFGERYARIQWDTGRFFHGDVRNFNAGDPVEKIRVTCQVECRQKPHFQDRIESSETICFYLPLNPFCSFSNAFCDTVRPIDALYARFQMRCSTAS